MSVYVINDVSHIEDTIKFIPQSTSKVKIGNTDPQSKDNLLVPSPNDPATVGQWGSFLNQNTFKEIQASFEEIKSYMDSANPILEQLILQTNKNDWKGVNNNSKGYGVKFGYSNLTTKESTRVYVHGYDKQGLPSTDNGWLFLGTDDKRSTSGDALDNIVKDRPILKSMALGPIDSKFENKVGMVIAEKGADGIYYPFLITVYRESLNSTDTKVFVDKWDKTTQTLVNDPVGIDTGITYPEHVTDQLSWYYASTVTHDPASGFGTVTAGDAFSYVSEVDTVKSLTKVKWNSTTESEENVIDTSYSHKNSFIKNVHILGVFDTKNNSGAIDFYYYSVNATISSLSDMFLQFSDEKNLFDDKIKGFKEKYNNFKYIENEKRNRILQDNLTRANIEQNLREFTIKRKTESGHTDVVLEEFNNSPTTPVSGWDVKTNGSVYPSGLTGRKRLISGRLASGLTELEYVAIHGKRSSEVMHLGLSTDYNSNASTMYSGLTLRGALRANRPVTMDSTLSVTGNASFNNPVSIPNDRLTTKHITSTSTSIFNGDVDVNAKIDVSGITKLASPGLLTTVRGGFKTDQASEFVGVSTFRNNTNFTGASSLLNVTNKIKTKDLQVTGVSNFGGLISATTLDVTGNSTMEDITSDGKLILTHATHLHDIYGNLKVRKDLTVQDDLHVTDNSTFGDKLTITSGGQETTGTAIFNSHIEANGSVNVDGALTSHGQVNTGNIQTSTLNVTGTSTLKNTNLTGKLDVTGEVETTTLDVTGTSAMAGRVDMENGLDINHGNLTVPDGDITASGDTSARYIYSREINGTTRRLLADIYQAKWAGSAGSYSLKYPKDTYFMIKRNLVSQVKKTIEPIGYSNVLFDGTDKFTSGSSINMKFSKENPCMILTNTSHIDYVLKDQLNDNFTVYFAVIPTSTSNTSNYVCKLSKGSNRLEIGLTATNSNNPHLIVKYNGTQLTDTRTTWESGGAKVANEIFRDYTSTPIKSVSLNFMNSNTLQVVVGGEIVAEYNYSVARNKSFDHISVGRSTSTLAGELYAFAITKFEGQGNFFSDYTNNVWGVNKAYNQDLEGAFGNFEYDSLPDLVDYKLGRYWTEATVAEDARLLDGQAKAWYAQSSHVGDITQLETKDKTNLVNAINEVRGGLDDRLVCAIVPGEGIWGNLEHEVEMSNQIGDGDGTTRSDGNGLDCVVVPGKDGYAYTGSGYQRMNYGDRGFASYCLLTNFSEDHTSFDYQISNNQSWFFFPINALDTSIPVNTTVFATCEINEDINLGSSANIYSHISHTKVAVGDGWYRYEFIGEKSQAYDRFVVPMSGKSLDDTFKVRNCYVTNTKSKAPFVKKESKNGRCVIKEPWKVDTHSFIFTGIRKGNGVGNGRTYLYSCGSISTSERQNFLNSAVTNDKVDYIGCNTKRIIFDGSSELLLGVEGNKGASLGSFDIAGGSNGHNFSCSSFEGLYVFEGNLTETELRTELAKIKSGEYNLKSYGVTENIPFAKRRNNSYGVLKNKIIVADHNRKICLAEPGTTIRVLANDLIDYVAKIDSSGNDFGDGIRIVDGYIYLESSVAFPAEVEVTNGR